MKYSFRWFGPGDPTNLNEIRQVGANHIVTSLEGVKYGEKWNNEAIQKRKKIIETINFKNQLKLNWSVVESLPVHNDIKIRSGKYQYYIEQYKDSLKNLSKNNIKTICYNFMPIVDWIRTDLNYRLSDGSIALKYNHFHMCIFEVFILKLKRAEERYTNNEISIAKRLMKTLTNKERDNIKKSLMGGLAANDRQYSLKNLRYEISQYKEINHTDLRNNLKLFLREIFPVLKDLNIYYCIHPDDPPYNIYGLPRIVSNEKDIKFITSIFKDEQNGITFCSGSLGVNKENNLVNIIRKYGKYINFIHLRNIIREDISYNFHEAHHLEGDVNMVQIIKALLKEEGRRKKNNNLNDQIPMRPDHGHTILHDQNRSTIPGYSLLGRMKGLAEIKGIIKSLE
jgi:mannonate dehydratase